MKGNRECEGLRCVLLVEGFPRKCWMCERHRPGRPGRGMMRFEFLLKWLNLKHRVVDREQKCNAMMKQRTVQEELMAECGR